MPQCEICGRPFVYGRDGVCARCGSRRVVVLPRPPGTQEGVEWVEPQIRDAYATSGIGWPD